MKKTFAIVLSVLLLLSLCACGASAKSQSARDSAYYVSTPAEAPMPEPEMAADEAAAFGGAHTEKPKRIYTKKEPMHGKDHSFALDLPGLSCTYLKYVKYKTKK